MNPTKSILVVESDPVVQGWLCHVLRASGFSASAADSLKQALTRLGTDTSFAAVICDYCLPDGTCLDLLAGLRGYRGTRVPVLLTSGSWLQPLPGEAGLELLAKPFDASQMLAALNRLLLVSAPNNFAVNDSAPALRRD